MDRQLALQRGFQALEDELGQRQPRGQRRTRARKTGSWRDRGRGDCFTRTNKNGGAYVVCEEGSKGQKAVYAANNRNVRGDEDQKGRKKDKAIRTNRSVMKKYDEEGRVEDLDEEIYFTPLREEGGFVILGRGLNTAGTAKRTKSEGISENVDTTNTIRVPKDEFNAQYRVMRGFTDPDDKFNDLAPTEYELQGDPDKPKLKEELINLEKKLKKEKRKVKKKGEEEEKKREARIKKVEDDIEEVELKLKPAGADAVEIKKKLDKVEDEYFKKREEVYVAGGNNNDTGAAAVRMWSATDDAKRLQKQIDKLEKQLEQTKTQRLIELQREVRGERLKQEADKEKVDEFVKEAQDLGGGKEGFRKRQRKRELARKAVRNIRETQQERRNREQINKDLVIDFERKVRDLDYRRDEYERRQQGYGFPDEAADKEYERLRKQLGDFPLPKPKDRTYEEGKELNRFMDRRGISGWKRDNLGARYFVPTDRVRGGLTPAEARGQTRAERRRAKAG